MFCTISAAITYIGKTLNVGRDNVADDPCGDDWLHAGMTLFESDHGYAVRRPLLAGPRS